VFEAVAENPYLADFYGDMQRWSFHSQVFFLSRRLKQHHALLQRPSSILQDRSVYEDAEIFAGNLFRQGQMMARDYHSYRELYEVMVELLPPPDLIIYLKASVTTLVRRITRRGRDYERGISPRYLAQLNGLYDSWIEDFTLCPVLTIDSDSLDFVRFTEDFDLIAHEVTNRLAHAEDTQRSD
jgi:deoxyadenosine/deoxycytidine kinase